MWLTKKPMVSWAASADDFPRSLPTSTPCGCHSVSPSASPSQGQHLPSHPQSCCPAPRALPTRVFLPNLDVLGMGELPARPHRAGVRLPSRPSELAARAGAAPGLRPGIWAARYPRGSSHTRLRFWQGKKGVEAEAMAVPDRLEELENAGRFHGNKACFRPETAAENPSRVGVESSCFELGVNYDNLGL